MNKIKHKNFPKMKSSLVFFFLFNLSLFGQKQYEFDYALKYDFYKPKISDTIEIYYLTNSKNNSYYASFTESEEKSEYFDFRFVDFNTVDETGIFSEFLIRKTWFWETSTIKPGCENIHSYKYPFQYQVKNYEFEAAKDTILNGKRYAHHLIKCTGSEKYIKRNNLGVTHFIIDKNTSPHIPFFVPQTVYEEWKTSKKIPFGMHQEKYYINLDGSLKHKRMLVEARKIEKSLMISEECD